MFYVVKNEQKNRESLFRHDVILVLLYKINIKKSSVTNEKLTKINTLRSHLIIS
jgi:hypothetical protein